LVAESIRILREAGVRESDCCVVAITADSFSDSVATFQYPAFGTKGIHRLRSSLTVGLLASSGVSTGKFGSMTELGKLVRQAELIVGVGGGYLRTPGGSASRLTALVHIPQLALAAASHAPSVYMPQSVGPLNGVLGNAIRRHLRHIDIALARDDTSIREVPGCGLQRYPDLAIMKIAREFKIDSRPERGEEIVLIARELGIEDYRSRLHRLASLLPLEWAVHSKASGQDDSQFYRSIGITESHGSEVLFARLEVGVAISVRLHGALQAINAGIPTIHLSYERKGYGAYTDLGIKKWVHSVHDFSPETVADQARELLRDPSEYWARIHDQVETLKTYEIELVERIRVIRGAK
jgi:hypothetical protein